MARRTISISSRPALAISGSRTEPPALPDSIPATLRAIVQRCLNGQPGDRFQSALNLAFALRNGSGATTAVPAADARRLIALGWRLAAVGAVVAVLASIGAYLRAADADRTTIPPDFAISNGMSWAGRLSLSYDGKSLVTAVSRATGDIWIADGIRPPQTWWSRLVRRR